MRQRLAFRCVAVRIVRPFFADGSFLRPIRGDDFVSSVAIGALRQPSARAGNLSQRSKFTPMPSPAAWVAAASLCILFMGATLPTPLYPLYEQAFGFSRLTLTLIYAAYVLGNLVALLALGRRRTRSAGG